VRDVSLWNEVLGVEKTVFEAVEYDQEQDLVVARVRPTKRARGRCGLCLRRCPGYDCGDGRRQWRALDLGTVKAVLEADAPRVSCRSPRGGCCGGALGSSWHRAYVRLR
jgi:transposase